MSTERSKGNENGHSCKFHSTNKLTKLFSNETAMRVGFSFLRVARTKRHEYFANLDRITFKNAVYERRSSIRTSHRTRLRP